jgi:hypothetical protein
MPISLPLSYTVNYGIERLNEEVSAWMRGETKEDGGKALPPFLAMGDSSSVMWNRSLSKEKWPSPSDRYTACRALQQALAKIGASRLVVGHTPQVHEGSGPVGIQFTRNILCHCFNHDLFKLIQLYFSPRRLPEQTVNVMVKCGEWMLACLMGC